MSSYGFVAPVHWDKFTAVVNSPFPGLDAICARALVDVADVTGFSRDFYGAHGNVGVAGYKSVIHALDALYEMHHRPAEGVYDCVPRKEVDRLLQALVERLFLGHRVWHPIPAPPCPRTWPAHDAPLLLGALAPSETRMLARRLPGWEARLTSSPMFDRLLERIRAAASHDLGLVALHSML